MTQSLAGVTELEQGDPYALVTLPYWAWLNKQALAMRILLEARGLNEFDFTWPLIKDNLHLCTCVFSGRRLEITPPCLPIHAIPSFTQARRRIYMTATLSDDSVLISHFNADASSVEQPITPKNASDIGDRMILIPQELNPDTTEEEIKQFVFRLSAIHNAVVIVPSNERAKFWSDVAKRTLTANNVRAGIEELRNSHVGLVVMVNRYDGIDLPGDACRVLVIDDLPDVRSLKDKIEQAALSGSNIYNARQIQRIEQGIGRGIRSNEDYCAVLLMEARLTHMLNSAGALDHLTPPTRAQLELSKRIAEQIEGKGLEAIEQVIGILISRSPEWVGAAKNALIDLSYKTSSRINPIIVQERRAFDTASSLSERTL